MARADVPEGIRRLFPILVDEFQNYAGAGMDISSIRSFLTEARKMNVPMILATQYLSQLDREAVTAIFGTVSAFIVLRCGPIDSRWLQRELGDFTEDDILNLETGQALVRMGLARDTFNARTPRRVFPTKDFRNQIVKTSRERHSRHVSEVEDILTKKLEGERVWIVDSSGNIFTENDIEKGAIPRQKRRQSPSSDSTTRRVPEKAASDSKGDPREDDGQHARVDKELIEYLEHASNFPFMPVARRNEELKLSKFRSPNIRKRLEEAGWIRQHKVSTGRRSGLITLVEVTEQGSELLASMRVRTQKVRGRGGFIHKFFASQLMEYALATWLECEARIEDGSRGRPADVVVTTREGRSIAFEVFVTGESKEAKGVAQDVQLFDEVIVCAQEPGALESLKARVLNILDEDMIKKVSFNLMSQYLAAGRTSEKQGSRPSTRANHNSDPDANSVPVPPLELEKSRPELELEPERNNPRRNKSPKRGRKLKTPLTRQIEEAYNHLHDLDWLQESELTNLPDLQEKVNPRQTMPEAQALRRLLLEAAEQVMSDISGVPDMSRVRFFVERYVAGKRVFEIAEEMGISREQCSRRYRKEAFALASAQFMRILSTER